MIADGSNVCQQSIIDNSTIDNATVCNNSTVTGNSTVKNGSSVCYSTIDNSTIDNATVLCNSTVSNRTIQNLTVSGSTTIKGTVISQSASSALSGVSVSYALSGTTVATTTTDSSGDFTQSSLATGTYTLSYSNSGYLDETQSVTLSTDGQTLKVTTLKMLSDSCASTGTISGKITDAVSSDNLSGVSISARRGLNFTSGTVIGTDNTG